MATEKQIAANRKNAAKSTGPTSEQGKSRSRQNAIRHGLTAETVVTALEDPAEYEIFAEAVRLEFRPQSPVEHYLVARLASLLWRLRRATAIETKLFELQGKILRDQHEVAKRSSDDGFGMILRLLHQSPATKDVSDSSSSPQTAERQTKSAEKHAQFRTVNSAAVFLRLCHLQSAPIERIGRYEVALWKQTAQTLFLLDTLKGKTVGR